ncbi:predicted protein [Plenodomus lingam JN3]|uniref:Predicted protein n=1 Tax=Leptosphaeria maculans (strain JN3 / isolate v23.1.3 / race Av1-4-5-6-7-8) TaxID=985895 RepID=E4ZT71_LEPMJ|nr:predicted protein [Plenodomus lingam JN3]CBX94502.1 predicted protein [Plenodomus lingam JN3]
MNNKDPAHFPPPRSATCNLLKHFSPQHEPANTKIIYPMGPNFYPAWDKSYPFAGVDLIGFAPIQEALAMNVQKEMIKDAE